MFLKASLSVIVLLSLQLHSSVAFTEQQLPAAFSSWKKHRQAFFGAAGALHQSTTSDYNVLSILTPETDNQGFLSKIAEPITFDDDGSLPFQQLQQQLEEEIETLHATLHHTQKTLCFGRAMAAPQAGISKRIIVLNLIPSNLISCPLTLINPEITWQSSEMQTVWDDCLSIPDKLIQVERHLSISLQFQDIHGTLHDWEELSPDLSELLQHELEHLDGILMLQHATQDDNNVKPNDLSHLQNRPENQDGRRISLQNIQQAYETMDPVFSNSQLNYNSDLSDLFGCNIWLKDETQNPIRCFKGRGATTFLNSIADNKKETAVPHMICASAGNWGQALAYGCGKLGFRCTVFVAETASPVKVAKLKELGAHLVFHGPDLDAAKDAAKTYQAEECKQHPTTYFVEDGKDAQVTEGAGTLGLELTQQCQQRPLDAVFIPVGNGALINGVARWMKAASPMTKIIGVVPAGSDSMFESWRQGQLVNRESVSTSADGLAVRAPIPEAMEDMKGLVDDMILIDEQHLESAMELAERHACLKLEPSGAASIAGLLAAQEQQPSWWDKLARKNVAVIITGANKAEA